MYRCIGCAITLVIVFAAGCRRADDTRKKDEPAPAVQPTLKNDNNGKPVAARTTARTKGPALLPFKDAVIFGDAVPTGELPPPDFACNGKNTIKLFETIANELWDNVVFTDKDGKAIRYKAIIATELGQIHVDLFGDSAPNHVRNFVSLARAGYYDGMSFYYSLHRQVDGLPTGYIETGCPRGTREFGSGSIGYWLRPEVSKTLKHEAGVLGACLGDDPNSAACRFYVTAIAMPQMDGRGSFTIFGKVTRGLDIVRTINTREVQETDLLREPVLIRSVTIQTVLD